MFNKRDIEMLWFGAIVTDMGTILTLLLLKSLHVESLIISGISITIAMLYIRQQMLKEEKKSKI